MTCRKSRTSLANANFLALSNFSLDRVYSTPKIACETGGAHCCQARPVSLGQDHHHYSHHHQLLPYPIYSPWTVDTLPGRRREELPWPRAGHNKSPIRPTPTAWKVWFCSKRSFALLTPPSPPPPPTDLREQMGSRGPGRACQQI